jgi:hypothetical protein
MFSPLILALAGFYGVLGVVIIRRVLKPTCRVCLFRQSCPKRQCEHPTVTSKPCWSRDQNAD